MTAAGYRTGRLNVAITPPRIALCLVLVLALGLRVEFARNHIDHPTPDARGYARIAESLYLDGEFGRRGSFGGAEVQEPSNYSPGAPLLAAGIYYVTGGVKPLLVRLVVALLGTVAVYFTFLIGRRLAGEWAGVLGALPLAIYPSLLEYHGMIMSEPLAIFTLSAAALSFLWASDEGRPGWAWLVPGIFFGLTALTRPEYLPFGLVFALLVLLRARSDVFMLSGGAGAKDLDRPAGPNQTLRSPHSLRMTTGGGPMTTRVLAFLLAFLVPIVPWTIHNYVKLDKFVPLSTGGSKALFIGTYYPGDGMNDKTKSVLLANNPQLRRRLFNESPAPRPSRPMPWLNLSLAALPIDGVQPQRLISQNVQRTDFVFLDRILETLAAQRHPGLEVDAALSREAKSNFWHYAKAEPLPYAWMFARKTWHMWRAGPRDTMKVPTWATFHGAVVVLGLGGLVVLAWRRRWEAMVLGALIVVITAEGTLLLAAERRVLVLMPLVCALAGASAVWLARIVRARRDAA